MGKKEKNPAHSVIANVQGFVGGRRWIRTIEARRNRFTVCPLWPLGNPSVKLFLQQIRLCMNLNEMSTIFFKEFISYLTKYRIICYNY